MIKKILCVVLAAILLVSLTACASQKPSSSTSSQTSDNPANPGNDNNGLLKLDTGLNGDEYFYIDREYAIDSTQVAPIQAEFDKAYNYLENYIINCDEKIAFDFSYDGKLFSEDYKTYEKSVEDKGEDDIKHSYVVTYTKSGIPLQVKVEANFYLHYPVCEWTVYLENTSNEVSKIISDFQGLKDTFGKASDGEYKVLTFDGSRDASVSFRPRSRVIEDEAVEIGGTSGRSSVRWSPYFNISWKNDNAEWGKEGVFVSVGWTGQWKASVEKETDLARVTAGLESLNTYLNPGESIRSPRMTLLFWERDIIRSQNIWRDFVYYEIMPKDDGKPMKTIVQMNNNVYVTNLMENATTENQIEGIRIRLENGLKFDQWQMDAGWTKLFGGSWWNSVGNWEEDSSRISLRAISDYAHENGLKTVLWFEPERVFPYSDFDSFKDRGWIIQGNGQSMLDFSEPEVLEYICQFVEKSLKDKDIDIYRQDCNFDVKPYWDAKDNQLDPDGNRVGYTENKYITNMYAYFDYLVSHIDGLLIDNCASGGKRMDFEIMSRALSLWRDDNCNDAIVTQCQTYGINLFNPYSGQSTIETNFTLMKYTNRSNFMQATNFVYNIEGGDQKLIDAVRDRINEYREYSPYFLCNYYPLTPVSEITKDWIGWQYHDKDNSSGIIQMFKRIGSGKKEDVCYLSGLEKDATYIITDIDTNEVYELSGEELMTNGFTIKIPVMQDAKLFHYVKK